MKSEDRHVILQPVTYQAMQRGISQIVEAVRPTLGPLPRIVAIEQAVTNRMPELLDNGALIARRIIQLPDRDADMGAMFLRHMLWRLYEKVGDGTATAAVLFQSIFDQGVRYVISGGNAMQLRHHLECGMRAIFDELTGMTVYLEGKRLTQIAETICYDPELAKMLGEIMEIVGAYGQIDIRTGRGRELEREYVEGMYWEGGILSREMITDHKALKAEVTDAGIMISDLGIEDPRQLVPVLETAIKAGVRSLIVVANRLSEKAIAFLLAASREPERLRVIAVKTPGLETSKQAEAMEDLSILTGGQAVIEVAGNTLEGLRAENLGRARKAWADPFYFGIVGGKGDPHRLRTHIRSLRAAYQAAENPEDRTGLQQRVGRLMGGSATLWVGGMTELEIEARKEVAKRTVKALRGAILEGVIPGGGISLLTCQPTLQRRLEDTADEDERAAYHILVKALEAPIRTLLSNAGCDASEVMAQIRLAGPGQGFDVRQGAIVDMAQAGIYDVATVQKAALHGAVSSAALALTVDVLIHHKQPKQSVSP